MNEKLINTKWFKDKKNIAILVLSVVCAVSISFAIYYARPGTVDHAEQLRGVLDEFESVMGKQYTSLESVLDDVRDSIELTDELERGRERSLELARQSDAGFVGLGESLDRVARSSATGLELLRVLISEQQRIDPIIRGLWENNRGIEESLTQR